MYHRQHI